MKKIVLAAAAAVVGALTAAPSFAAPQFQPATIQSSGERPPPRQVRLKMILRPVPASIAAGTGSQAGNVSNWLKSCHMRRFLLGRNWSARPRSPARLLFHTGTCPPFVFGVLPGRKLLA